MKRYLFAIGLCLVLLGTGWLIHTVRDPLPSDSVHSYFAVRAKRGNATLALCTVFLGLGLILADAFTTPNPRLERIEREKEVLREEILGCGSDCRGFALIDARSGRVYFNPRAPNVIRAPFEDEDSLQFRPDSRLLIVSGSVDGFGGRKDEAKFYYEWRNNRFRLLTRTKIKKSNE